MSRIGGFLSLFCAALLAAACGSSTSTATSPATVSRCGVSISQSDLSVPASGGSGRLAITTARECAWSASTSASWLTIRGDASGQGDGSIEYVVSANPDPSTRTGAIDLNNQRAQVTQAGGQCTMQLGQTTGTFTNAGGTGTIGVTASSSQCQWTAVPDSPWITIRSGGSGSGNGTVTFEVAPAAGPPRAGTIVVAGLRFAVTQAEGCTYAITPSSFAAAASGGTATVSVATGAGCPWAAASNVDWATVANGVARTGPGTVQIAVSATAGGARSGTALVAGQVFAINQATGCSYGVTPRSFTFDAGAGAGTVTVDTGPGCGWSATSDASWIVPTGSTSGNGPGALSFVVAASSGAARSGTLTVAGQGVAISQSAACSFTIAPEGQAFDPGGGEVTVNVTAAAGCAWSATSNASWITVASGSSGSGPGTVKLVVDKQTGGPRTGSATIAGRTFTVTQSGGCSVAIAPTSATAPAAGGSGTVAVTAGEGCGWTAVSNDSWLTVTAGTSGSGNGTVQYAAAPLASGTRSGTLTIGGQTFTVSQTASGTTCTFSIAPRDAAIAAAGGTASVAVTATSGCAWASSSSVPWIAVTSGTNGNGDGSVQLSIAANPGGARSGTVTIAGQTFTVNQAAASVTCSFGIAPTDAAIPAAGGTTTVSVSATSGCAWTAVSGAPWITVAAGASGTGDGSVRLTFENNPGDARSGVVTIAGQTFTVNQAGSPTTGCTYTLSGSSRNVPGKQDDYTLQVTTNLATCPWTATSDVPWLTFTTGSGTGSGTISYHVAENTTRDMRVGTITVAGQTFTVMQNK